MFSADNPFDVSTFTMSSHSDYTPLIEKDTDQHSAPELGYSRATKGSHTAYRRVRLLLACNATFLIFNVLVLSAIICRPSFLMTLGTAIQNPLEFVPECLLVPLLDYWEHGKLTHNSWYEDVLL